MLLIDDLLVSPFRGLCWVFREIHNTAQQELANEADAIRPQLSQLYMMLETGKISEPEFEAEEKRLLDRLDELEHREQALEVEVS
jgi:Gas vesicle protein G